MRRFDDFLIKQPEKPDLEGWRRFVQEFLFFVSVFAVPRVGLMGIPRFDLLLIIAVGIQGIESWSYPDFAYTKVLGTFAGT